MTGYCCYVRSYGAFNLIFWTIGLHMLKRIFCDFHLCENLLSNTISEMGNNVISLPQCKKVASEKMYF